MATQGTANYFVVHCGTGSFFAPVVEGASLDTYRHGRKLSGCFIYSGFVGWLSTEMAPHLYLFVQFPLCNVKIRITWQVENYFPRHILNISFLLLAMSDEMRRPVESATQICEWINVHTATPVIKYEPRHEISNNVVYVVCATNKDSDQPAHTRSLIRAFAGRLNSLRLFSYWLNIIWSFYA